VLNLTWAGARTYLPSGVRTASTGTLSEPGMWPLGIGRGSGAVPSNLPRPSSAGGEAHCVCGRARGPRRLQPPHRPRARASTTCSWWVRSLAVICSKVRTSPSCGRGVYAVWAAATPATAATQSRRVRSPNMPHRRALRADRGAHAAGRGRAVDGEALARPCGQATVQQRHPCVAMRLGRGPCVSSVRATQRAAHTLNVQNRRDAVLTPPVSYTTTWSSLRTPSSAARSPHAS
jgi:hypothetical protein